MEINITKFFNEACPMDYSASVAEIGNDAGKITYQAAKDDAGEYNMLDTEEKQEAFKEFVKGYGAWSDEEIAAWSLQELNALFIQFVSGDMREAGMDAVGFDWESYEKDTQEGIVAGRIFKGSDNEIYFEAE